MKSFIATFLALIFLQSGAFSQHKSLFVDVSAGLLPDRGSMAASVWMPRVSTAKSNSKWQFSPGIRLSGYRKTSTEYLTAPSQLTSGSFGPHVIFLPNKPENFDTLSVASSSLFSLNLAISVSRKITRKFSAEFNIDLAGISAGSFSGAVFNPENPSKNIREVTGKPTRWNLLILSDSDFGSLNSEFALSGLISKKITLRGGMAFNFTEITTDQTLQPDNRRFRSKTALPFVALRFSR